MPVLRAMLRGHEAVARVAVDYPVGGGYRYYKCVPRQRSIGMSAGYDCLGAVHIKPIFNGRTNLAILPERGGSVGFPYCVPVEHRLAALPMADDGLVASLPELGARDVVVGVVPHQPPLLVDGELDGNPRRNFRVAIYK